MLDALRNDPVAINNSREAEETNDIALFSHFMRRDGKARHARANALPFRRRAASHSSPIGVLRPAAIRNRVLGGAQEVDEEPE